MIYFSWGNKNIGSQTVNITCRACSHYQLDIIGRQNILSIYGIPSLPLSNHSSILFCKSCGTSYDTTLVNKTLEKEIKFKTPIWAFSGTIIILLLVIYGVFADSHTQKNITAFRESPIEGQIFTFKDINQTETPYFVAKIKTIDNNKITLQLGNHMYSRPPSASSKEASGENFSDNYHELDIDDFKNMAIKDIIFTPYQN